MTEEELLEQCKKLADGFFELARKEDIEGDDLAAIALNVCCNVLVNCVNPNKKTLDIHVKGLTENFEFMIESMLKEELEVGYSNF